MGTRSVGNLTKFDKKKREREKHVKFLNSKIHCLFLFKTRSNNNYYMFISHNDVSNQQDATTFSFIDLFFKLALHVSGEKFAHHQEHFMTLCTAFGTMYRHCCRPVHCTKSCIYSQKVLLRIGEFVARNM